MNNKQKKLLKRIIISAVLALITLVLSHFVNEKIEYFMIVPYLIVGHDILVKSYKNMRNVIDENVLMTVATIGALLLREFNEALAVMLFYQIGELFNSIAVGKSRKSIESLISIKADVAHKVLGDETEDVLCEEIEIGDVLLVKPGEIIPVDSVVVEGKCDADTSSITGEPVSKELYEGQEAVSGYINLNGAIKVKAVKSFENSTVSKIMDLVENASSKKSETERFITRFARIYTPIVVFLALAIGFICPIFSDISISEWIHRGLIFLVVSCPCALVISVPLAYFASIGCASKKGILIKGSNVLERLSAVDCAVFDKTGTLTLGKPVISDVFSENITDKDLIFTAAIAQKNSTHPLAKAIVACIESIPDATNYEQIAGRGVKCEFNGKTILCGNLKMMKEAGIEVKNEYEETAMYVALNKDYLGVVTFADELKPTSKTAVEKLKSVGVKCTAMLTGDTEASAKKVADEVGIDTFKAGLLPEDKVKHFDELMKSFDSVAFTGDGINDAPVIARADVGVAMGALGSDAAIEACDVVLMNDDPELLAEAISVSKKTMRIVRQNIFFAIGVKVVVMILGAFGLAGVWQAVFADVGVAVLAILNSMRMLKSSRS